MQSKKRIKRIIYICWRGKNKRIWCALFVSAKLRRVFMKSGRRGDYNENLRGKLSKKAAKGLCFAQNMEGEARCSPQLVKGLCFAPGGGRVVVCVEATSINVSRETQEILHILIFFY